MIVRVDVIYKIFLRNLLIAHKDKTSSVFLIEFLQHIH